MWNKQKAFGQNFLVDQKIIQKIINFVWSEIEKINPKKIIEIGPGKGALTLPFLDAYKKMQCPLPIVILEKDRELVEEWRISHPELSLIETDAVFYPWKEEEEEFFLFSNLPYSAGTKILLEISKTSKCIGMVVMMQKEVADRVMAKPRTKEYGSLSIALQNEYECTSSLFVPPESFRPKPKVDSKVLVLRKRKSRLIQYHHEDPSGEYFQEVVKYLFSQRRKMLRVLTKGNELFTRALEASSVEGTKRSEELEFQEIERIYQSLCSNKFSS